MIGLFDRDVFLKLACCNLWEEALQALELDGAMRLISTESMVSNRSVIKRWLPEELRNDAEQRIQALIAEVPTISDELANSRDEALMARLEGAADVDGGEQLLIAILHASPGDRILVSGDKRFLNALITSYDDVYQAVQSSLISFERCLLAILAQHGFEYVKDRCLPVCRCDGSLRLALGGDPNEHDFVEALRSYDPLPDDGEADEAVEAVLAAPPVVA